MSKTITAQVKSATKIVQLNKVPYGVYSGVWGGYRVVFGEFELKVDKGIRCPAAPCIVVHTDSKFIVQTVN